MAKNKKTVKTATFSGGELQIYSRWQCTYGPMVIKGITVSPYRMPQGQPTTGSGKTTISYSIPSGAKIISSAITAKYIKPATGVSLLKLNGGIFKGNSPITLSGNSGSVDCQFLFKANGKWGDGADINPHVSTLTLSNITLTIKYEDNAEGDNNEQQPENEQAQAIRFRVPPQSVCVYDQDEKKLYTFDGVIKIQQNMSLKIEEDPSKKKELYVNNARNEPDKVTIDVAMSDVYGSEVSGQLNVESTSFNINSARSIGAGGGTTRSSRAVNLLHTLKEARRMLTVVTPQYVYTDMLLQGVTISQDDTCPFGWQGQLTFQEKYEEVQKRDTTSSTQTAANGGQRTPSIWMTTIFGKR